MKILSPQWRRAALQHRSIDGGPDVPEGMSIDLWVFAYNPLMRGQQNTRMTAVLTVARGDRHVATVANAAMIRTELMGHLVTQMMEKLDEVEDIGTPGLTGVVRELEG